MRQITIVVMDDNGKQIASKECNVDDEFDELYVLQARSVSKATDACIARLELPVSIRLPKTPVQEAAERGFDQ